MTQIQLDEVQIREAAYQFWLNDGQPNGRDEEHWLRAIDALSQPTPKAKPVRKKAVAKTAAAKTKATKATAAKAAPKRAAKPKAAK
ncbi:MAG: DUF2934 domain-containing protein [Planktotalea sp.]|uniref:DUF2934 domain-containing protein n=1 Tax=Planktotalea sp. TaxID=2029877 RepID=UPI003C790634